MAFGVRTNSQEPKFDPGDANGSTAECTMSLPVEPEWEEEDVYLRSRRDALHAMRSASRHSRAASNAFLRADHSAAQHHSSKAREQWTYKNFTRQKLSNKPPSNRSVSSTRDIRIHQTSVAPRSSSSGCLPADKLDKPLTSVPRPITGIGKHSKEQSALPTAVRSFLGETATSSTIYDPG